MAVSVSRMMHPHEQTARLSRCKRVSNDKSKHCISPFPTIVCSLYLSRLLCPLLSTRLLGFSLHVTTCQGLWLVPSRTPVSQGPELSKSMIPHGSRDVALQPRHCSSFNQADLLGGLHNILGLLHLVAVVLLPSIRSIPVHRKDALRHNCLLLLRKADICPLEIGRDRHITDGVRSRYRILGGLGRVRPRLWRRKRLTLLNRMCLLIRHCRYVTVLLPCLKLTVLHCLILGVVHRMGVLVLHCMNLMVLHCKVLILDVRDGRW